ncbi:hypothetical protein N7523_006154 [Penicillium sp. IBT 18751x]|nr:hypothetical protein N7523_006154 [Penicillium sp. IBT 18751x]
MCDVPFFPIFPICFQCGTDQNPCHCKVVSVVLSSRPYVNDKRSIVAELMADLTQVVCWPASIFCGCGCTQTGREYELVPCSLLVTWANERQCARLPGQTKWPGQ